MDIKDKQLTDEIDAFFRSEIPRIEYERSCFLYDINDNAGVFEMIADYIGKVFLNKEELRLLPNFLIQKVGLNMPVAYGISYEINERIFLKAASFFADSAQLSLEWKKYKQPPILSEQKAWKRVLDIEPWILEQQKEKELEIKEGKRRTEIEAKKYVDVAFEEALRKYPKLGEQIISSNVLKLKIFPTPVRPSIKNWITDYHDNVGSGRHGSVERGNYLFQGENGRKLTPVERYRVGEMLKAMDQNSQVKVDTEKEMLILEEPQMPNSNESKIQNSPEPIKKNITDFFSNKDNVYVSKVQHDSVPSVSQDRNYSAKKSFAPNFADNQSFTVSKRSEIAENVAQFRNESARNNNPKSDFGSDDFHDFPGGEKNIDGEFRFSSSQKFSAEKDMNSKQPGQINPGSSPQVKYRQSWQNPKTSNNASINNNVVDLRNQ